MKINLFAIAMIESGGNPHALNQKSGARGLFQITSICLKEWNNFHPEDKHDSADLYNPDVNRKIAEWYLDVRIPSMLRAYGMPDTFDMILASYNAGIGVVRKWRKGERHLPQETMDYIQAYKDLTRRLT